MNTNIKPNASSYTNEYKKIYVEMDRKVIQFSNFVYYVKNGYIPDPQRVRELKYKLRNWGYDKERIEQVLSQLSRPFVKFWVGGYFQEKNVQGELLVLRCFPETKEEITKLKEKLESMEIVFCAYSDFGYPKDGIWLFLCFDEPFLELDQYKKVSQHYADALFEKLDLKFRPQTIGLLEILRNDPDVYFNPNCSLLPLCISESKIK